MSADTMDASATVAADASAAGTDAVDGSAPEQTTGNHDDGTGICVPVGTCAAGFHDGGAGSCVAAGTCSQGFLAGGGGNCLKEKSVAAGFSHTCAALVDGTVQCWGENSNGQLGIGNTLQQEGPVAIPGLGNVRHSAGETTNGKWRAQVLGPK